MLGRQKAEMFSTYSKKKARSAATANLHHWSFNTCLFFLGLFPGKDPLPTIIFQRQTVNFSGESSWFVLFWMVKFPAISRELLLPWGKRWEMPTSRLLPSMVLGVLVSDVRIPHFFFGGKDLWKVGSHLFLGEEFENMWSFKFFWSKTDQNWTSQQKRQFPEILNVSSGWCSQGYATERAWCHHATVGISIPYSLSQLRWSSRIFPQDIGDVSFPKKYSNQTSISCQKNIFGFSGFSMCSFWFLEKMYFFEWTENGICKSYRSFM